MFPEVVIVGEAADGREALKSIAKLQPDLVFLDLQMPVMSGFEVVQNPLCSASGWLSGGSAAGVQPA